MRTLLLAGCLALMACRNDVIGPDPEWLLGEWVYDETLCQPGGMRSPATRLGYELRLSVPSREAVVVHRDSLSVSHHVRFVTGANRQLRVADAEFDVAPFHPSEVSAYSSLREWRFEQKADGTLEVGPIPGGATDGCWHIFRP
jgi:hypothetical protein